MSYNIKELLALPDDEKIVLANTLWNTVGETANDVLTTDEIDFIEERLNLHRENPSNKMTWEEVKEKIKQKYGF